MLKFCTLDQDQSYFFLISALWLRIWRCECPASSLLLAWGGHSPLLKNVTSIDNYILLFRGFLLTTHFVLETKNYRLHNIYFLKIVHNNLSESQGWNSPQSSLLTDRGESHPIGLRDLSWMTSSTMVGQVWVFVTPGQELFSKSVWQRGEGVWQVPNLCDVINKGPLVTLLLSNKYISII